MNYKDETLGIRLQQSRSQENEHSVPLYLTSSFVFDSAEEMRAAFADENDENIYSRFSNPNTDELIQKMCALERAEAGLTTASGMAAVFNSILGLLKSGDHLVACKSIFGSTHTLITKYLHRWGISYTYVDANQPNSWAEAFQSNTKMFFLESPTNPALDIIDITFAAQLAHQHGAILNVDNCFATPLSQKPIALGADLVVHSATKYLDGQGRVLGGLILGKKEIIEELFLFLRNTGPCMSPFNAWVISKSIETLDVRLERHSSNAQFIAEQLEELSKNNKVAIQQVRYPFLLSHPQYHLAKKQMQYGGGMLSFELVGGIQAGRAFLDALQLISVTANLGDTRTIASHPASTTHAKLTEEERISVGITPGLIRISVGLENREDILHDIIQALPK